MQTLKTTENSNSTTAKVHNTNKSLKGQSLNKSHNNQTYHSLSTVSAQTRYLHKDLSESGSDLFRQCKIKHSFAIVYAQFNVIS